jgi:hypothetical protein
MNMAIDFDSESAVLKRVKALCRAATARWGDLVQVGMTDLFGDV